MSEGIGGGIHFESTMSNEKMNAAIDETVRRVKGMSDATVAGGKKMDVAFDGTAESIRAALTQIGAACEEHEQELQRLEAEYQSLGQKASAAFTAGRDNEYRAIKEQKEAIGGEIALRKNLLNEFRGQSDALEKEAAKIEENKRKTEQAGQAKGQLRTQVMNLKDELAKLEQAGERNTDGYREMQVELGRLQDAMTDANTQAKIMSDDYANLNTAIEVISGVTGAFSVAQGAVGMFAGENENLQKIMTKVQSLMAITIGLQQVSKMLNKDSYTQLVLVRKAKDLLAASELKFATALGISNVAAKALMATLTLGLSVAITAIVVMLDRFITKNREAKKAQEEFNESVIETAVEAIASLNELSFAYDKLGDNLKEKEKFIEDNADKFEDLGFSVKTVKDAENLLINNKEKFIESCMLKAKAIATQQLAVEQYKKVIEAEQKLDETPKAYVSKKGEYTDGYGTKRKGMVLQKSSEWQDAENTVKEAKNIYENLINQQYEFTAAEQKILTKIGANADKIADTSIKALEDKISKLQTKYKEAANDKEREKFLKQLQESNDLLSKLDKTKNTTTSTKTTQTDDPVIKEINAEREVQKQQEETEALLKEYSSRLDQKINLEIQYANDVALLRKAKGEALSNEDKARIDRTIAYRKEKYNEDLQNIIKTGTEGNLRLIEIAKDNKLSEISRKKYLWESDRQKDILETQKQAILANIRQLEQLQSNAPTKELAEEIEDLKGEVEELNAELEKMPKEKFQEMLTGLQKVTSSLGKLDGELGEVFANISGSIDGIKVAFDETSSSVDKVSAGIGAIVDIINMVSQASKKRKQVEKEFYQNQIALAHEYALALNEVLRTQSEMSGNGFVTDYAGKINDGFEALTDATSNYQNAIGELANGKAKIDLSNAVDWGNVGKGVGAGATAGALVGSVVPVIGTAIGAVGGAIIGGLVGLFGGKKKKEEFGGLLDVFPDLVDGAGNLNKELAQTLINTNQVDEGTKQLLQNSLDWADAVEAANEQMKEVVVDLAGDLGNGIKNALIEAFKAGEDASEKMFGAMNKSLESFIDSLLFGMYFNDILEDFKTNMSNSMTDDGMLTSDEIIEAYEALRESAITGQEGYLNALKIIKEQAKDDGFRLWVNDDDSDSSSALKGSLKGASEETMSMVGGQLNAIRINQMVANDLLRIIATGKGDANVAGNTAHTTEIMRKQLLHLSNIDNNTGAIDRNTRYIKDIYNKMNTNAGGGDSLRGRGTVTTPRSRITRTPSRR